MRYFVIMGNTRVGSTWLASSMHNLPSVFCTREIRWRMPYQGEAPPVHTYIDSTTHSMKERLEFGYRAAAKRKEVAAIGAKLKFDPYGYAPRSAFLGLRKILEGDVHVIFLRRPYFEIFQTWKAFGIRHLANPNARNLKSRRKGQTGGGEEKLNRFHTMHGAPLRQKRVMLTSDDNVIARTLRNRFGGGDTLRHSIADAIDDLLVLFFNDVLGLTVIEGRDGVNVLCYKDIRSRFLDLAQSLSLSVTAEDCLDALDEAATSQIEPPGLDLVFPVDALKEVSEYLDSTFHEIRTGELSAEAVIRHDEQEGTVTYHLPGLSSILAKRPETASLLRGSASSPPRFLRIFAPARRVEGRDLRMKRLLRSLFATKARCQNGQWVAQRPTYVPIAVAPKPAVVPAALEASTHIRLTTAG